MAKIEDLFEQTEQGTWTYRPYIGGRRVRLTGKTKPHLKAKYDQAVADDAAGTEVDPRAKTMTFAQWWTDWFVPRTDLSAKARQRVDGCYAKRIEQKLGDRRLTAINATMMRKWVTELSAEGLSPATVRKYIGPVAKALDAAIAEGVMRGPNPAKGKHLNLPKITRKRPRVITPEQIGWLINAADPRYRVMIRTLAYSGLRLGELCALHVWDLDLDKGTITVNKTLVDTGAKVSIKYDTKSEDGTRTVPIPKFLTEDLRAQVEGKEPNELVFTSPTGGFIRVGSWRHRFWYPITPMADLDRLRIHDLRHTAISLWIAAGASMLQCKEWAGHASIKTTIDIYGHLFPMDEEGPMSALEAMAG